MFSKGWSSFYLSFTEKVLLTPLKMMMTIYKLSWFLFVGIQSSQFNSSALRLMRFTIRRWLRRQLAKGLTGVKQHPQPISDHEAACQQSTLSFKYSCDFLRKNRLNAIQRPQSFHPTNHELKCKDLTFYNSSRYSLASLEPFPPDLEGLWTKRA